MFSDEARTRRDVDFARAVGDRYMRRMLAMEIQRDDWFNPAISDRSSSILLHEMLGEVYEYQDDLRRLGPQLINLPEWRNGILHRFGGAMESAFRQVSLARSAELWGLVSVRDESSGL